LNVWIAFIVNHHHHQVLGLGKEKGSVGIDQESVEKKEKKDDVLSKRKMNGSVEELQRMEVNSCADAANKG